jgi:membrane protease YdiL (CAAX protease family)
VEEIADQVAGADATRGQRVRLAVEYAVLFFGAVIGYTLAGSPGSPIPVLLMMAGLAAWYLRRRPDFDRASFWRAAGLRGQLPAMLARWAVAVAVTLAGLAVFAPDRLFDLPRERPLIWAFVAVFYPLLSVYPQELVYRAFLMYRYAPVFGTGRGLIVASAAAFGNAHIIFGNALSVVLTLAGGALFATRYRRTGSLLAASVEHALYGLLVFTAGLGEYFYHGA